MAVSRLRACSHRMHFCFEKQSSAFLECCVMPETLQKTEDARVMVIHVRLARVYIEKQMEK